MYSPEMLEKFILKWLWNNEVTFKQQKSPKMTEPNTGNWFYLTLLILNINLIIYLEVQPSRDTKCYSIRRAVANKSGFN